MELPVVSSSPVVQDVQVLALDDQDLSEAELDFLPPMPRCCNCKVGTQTILEAVLEALAAEVEGLSAVTMLVALPINSFSPELGPDMEVSERDFLPEIAELPC